MTARVVAAGVLTGWGERVAALPDDARAAAGGRRVIPLAPPDLGGERFRRATRECLLGVAAVRALLRDGGLTPDALGGDTALLYVTAAAYGASNRLFIDADGGPGGALHFPYTAPSAVPAEVAIEFGLTGPYVVFVGGAATTHDAIWYAGRLLAEHAAERVLVLGVETYAECEDLWTRGRWLCRWPLAEAAACVLFASGVGDRVPDAAETARLEALVARRAGETLACAPLIALALVPGDTAVRAAR